MKAAKSQSCEISVVAVDVVDASYETMCPNFDNTEEISKQIAKSDIVIRRYDGVSKVFAFATSLYQKTNSQTVVYALRLGL